MNEFWLNTLEFFGLAWWIEVTTEAPNCTYYFGPYTSADEAKLEQQGFIEDLEQEGAKNLRVNIKRCKPTELTVVEEQGDRTGSDAPSVLIVRPNSQT